MAGPSTAHAVYGAMLGGTQAQVVGKSEDGTYWVISIPVAPLGQGWVLATNVQTQNTDSVPVIAAPPVLPPVIPDQPAATDPQVQAIQNVYVRSGPGDTYPAYGIAPTGTQGIVLGVSEDSNWWMVRISPSVVGAGFGWVSADWVVATNTEGVPVVKSAPPQEPVTLPPPASGVPTATATDFVNLRSGPGTNFTVLGVAPPGATSEVIGVSPDSQWWVVRVPTNISSNGQAWVSANFTITTNTSGVPVVQPPPAPPVVQPVPPTNPSAAIATAIEAINVRSGPGTNFPSFGVAPSGAQAPVIGVIADRTWWQISG